MTSHAALQPWWPSSSPCPHQMCLVAASTHRFAQSNKFPFWSCLQIPAMCNPSIKNPSGIKVVGPHGRF